MSLPIPIGRATSAVAVALLLAAAVPAQLRATRIATGFSSSIYMTAPTGDDRLFVVERSGVIKIIENGTTRPTPFLNIISKIRSGGERGLLGLAFAPDYDQSGEFYVSYTRLADSASILERYHVSSANPDVADATSGQVVYGPVSQPYSNHNGGCIQFGPDGYLYFGLGDGGSAGDPGCRSQNNSTPLGKILRFDVSGPRAVAPTTNPFTSDPNALDDIWANGVRNPWRFSFDRETGDLWIADVGQSSREEINFQPASSTGGENYGWKIMEGSICYSTSSCAPGYPPCNSPLLTDPVQEYSHSSSRCSITGGYVYRGCAYPSLRGTYFYADYCTGEVWSFRLQNGVVTDYQTRTSQLGSLGPIASFGEDGHGELYIVSLIGSIYRLEPTVTVSRDLGQGKTGSNGLTPRFSVCGLLSSGETAEVRLDDAPAMAYGAFIVGTNNAPTAFPPWGSLVPNPQDVVVAISTDAQGSFRATVPGGTGAATVYGQFIVADSGLADGIGISNALEIFVR